MNGNDDNSMHTERKRATSVLHVHSHMAKCADVCVRLCVERAIVALGSVWRGGIDLGLTTDRIFKEHPQPLSAIAEENQPAINQRLQPSRVIDDSRAEATANRCQWSRYRLFVISRFGLQLN